MRVAIGDESATRTRRSRAVADASSPVRTEAWVGTFGPTPGMPPEQALLARLIVAWGNNVTWSNLHLTPIIRRARKAGAKLVVGTGFALLLARPFPGRWLVFMAIFLPWAYPASVSVIGWYWTLSPPIPTASSPLTSQPHGILIIGCNQVS